MKNFFFSILLVTSSAQAQWSITGGPTEPNVTSLASNDSILIAGCSSLTLNLGGYRSVNEGVSWTPSPSNVVPSKFKCLTIHPNSGVIFAGTINSLYQSYDNGQTFTSTSTGLPSYNVNNILVDGSDLFASVQGIYISTNGGFNWSLISPSMPNGKMDKNGNTILYGTMIGGVYLSMDNGVSWTNPTAGLPNIFDVKIAGTNLLVASSSGVYISNNNGANWSLTNLTIITTCIYQLGTVLFAGTDNGVFYSTDGGNIWIATTNAGLTNTMVYSLSSNSNYLFAGTTGYVFRRQLSDFPFLFNNLNQKEFSGGIFIQPNPSSGIISISNANQGNLEIEVFNQVGSLVFRSILTNNISSIDLSHLTKGIYFAKIVDNNNEIVNRKIILE